VRYAADLGLDVDLFREDLRRHVGADRIADDVDSAGSSGVAGTPTFFIKGRRQYGTYGIDTLTAGSQDGKGSGETRPAVVPGDDQKLADGVHGSAWQRLVDPCSGPDLVC
jgi:DSBA-like thioredoxin domain